MNGPAIAELKCDSVLPPPSDTLWRFLTGGYEYSYIVQMDDDIKGNARVLIDRAVNNWRKICEEVRTVPGSDHG